MTLYVDHARTPYGRLRLSHLMADTTGELEQARISLGLPPSAWHHPATPDEHLDIGEAERTLAIARLGAVPVTSRYLVTLRQRLRQYHQNSPPQA